MPPETIEIRYPGGQVAPRPRPVTQGTEIIFTSPDGKDLQVEFVGESPLKSNPRPIRQGDVHTITAKPGRYKFDCSVEINGERVPLTGGEIEVGN